MFGPLGVIATSFQKPTKFELAHDFLWRIHKAVPAAGTIGVFNRSHYEDVLVARVHDLVPRDRIEERYGQINAFERHLAENDVTIVKFYLHISKKEQKARLQANLDAPNKHASGQRPWGPEFDEHGLIVNLKTTERLPSAISDTHGRQGAYTPRRTATAACGRCYSRACAS